MAQYLDEINQIAQVVGVYDAFAVSQPYDLAMLVAVDLRNPYYGVMFFKFKNASCPQA